MYYRFRVATMSTPVPHTSASTTCPVKTAQAVPKEKMTEVMAALDRVTLHAPVRTGQVVLADVCGTGVDVVATRNL